MGNLICASCRACPEIKESVTTVAVSHYDDRYHDDRYAGSAARQQTATAVVTTASPSLTQPAAAAASQEASKQHSSVKTDNIHPAVNANDAAAIADVARKHLSSNGISSAWELYLSPELQASLSHRNSSEDDQQQQLSDIEKVARGIVDINIFITSQVIMPALERYLKEMNEPQQQQQQQQLGTDDITVDVHNSDDIVDDDSDCIQAPFDRRHSDGLTIRVDNGVGIHLVDRVTMY